MKIELAHDTLAREIYNKASSEDKTIMRIENLVKEDYTRYLERGVLMTRKDIHYVMPFWDVINISTDQREFILKSRRAYRRRILRINIGVITALILLSLLGILAFYNAYKANIAREQAQISAQQANANRRIAEEARTQALSNERSALRAQMALDSALVTAIEQQRIAEANALRARQAEQVAYEKSQELNLQIQEVIAARQVAERNRADAEAARETALDNYEMLKLAEKSAVESAVKANEERQKADSIANAMRIQKEIALARVQANEATLLIQDGNWQTGGKQALAAYDTLAKHGATFDLSLFTALHELNEQLPPESHRPDMAAFHALQRETQSAAVRSVALAQDDGTRWLAYATEDQRIHLRNSKGYRQALDLNGRPRSMAFVDGHRLLWVATLEGRVTTLKYNAASNKYQYVRLPSLGPRPTTNGPVLHLQAVRLSPDAYLIAYSDANRLHLELLQRGNFDSWSGRPLPPIPFQQMGKITALALSQDGQYLAIANTNALRVAQLQYDNRLKALTIVPMLDEPRRNEWGAFSALAAHTTPDGLAYLAWGTVRGWVGYTPLASLGCSFSLDCPSALLWRAHRARITQLQLDARAKRLLSASLDRQGHLWEIPILLGETSSPRGLALPHNKWAWTATMDDGLIFTGGEDKAVRVWYRNIEPLYEEAKRRYALQMRGK